LLAILYIWTIPALPCYVLQSLVVTIAKSIYSAQYVF